MSEVVAQAVARGAEWARRRRRSHGCSRARRLRRRGCMTRQRRRPRGCSRARRLARRLGRVVVAERGLYGCAQAV